MSAPAPIALHRRGRPQVLPPDGDRSEWAHQRAIGNTGRALRLSNR